jgi:hypothetical protein
MFNGYKAGNTAKGPGVDMQSSMLETSPDAWEQTEDDDSFPVQGISTKRNFPRRNLSVHDMGSTKKKPLQHSSLSDLTDEISATPADEIGECDLHMPYAEVVTIAGVSDIPELNAAHDEEVPPALSIGRAKKPTVPKPKLNAVISLIAPHKLLILTKDFCNLFGYSIEAEICGRAVKILQGPRTDPSALSSAIKNCAAGSSLVRTIVLYGRDGNDIEVEASFSPYICGDESLAGCLMEIKAIPTFY